MSETQWRTHRLELDDQTLREWEGTVLAADAEGIVLDRSAFYPGGGGQPPDHGVLLWGGVQTRIVGARKTSQGLRCQAARSVFCNWGQAVASS
jgi:misacylated tRNA(Ala) deacylase